MFLKKWYLFVIIAFTLTLVGCSKDDNSIDDTELKITFHDSLVGTEEISSIDINVLRIEIIDIDGNKSIISDEAISFNLLDLTANNPVTLAHTSVTPGMYSQIRLVLDENSSITFTDGRVEPLKVPSGEQTGIKIDGVFDLPSGQFYTLDIDLIPGESIHYTPGNGYIMKPVIELTGSHINSGNFYYAGEYGGHPFTIKLNTDGSMNALYGGKSKYRFSGNYNFNSNEQTLTVATTKVTCPSCNWLKKKLLKKAKMPSPIEYNVNSFSKDRISLTDQSANTLILRKTPSFTLIRTSVPNETLTLNFDLNNSAYANKALLIRLVDTNTSLTEEGYYGLGVLDENSTTSMEIDLSGYEFEGGEFFFDVAAVIIHNEDNVTFSAIGISSVGDILASNFYDLESISVSIEALSQYVDLNLTEIIQ